MIHFMERFFPRDLLILKGLLFSHPAPTYLKLSVKMLFENLLGRMRGGMKINVLLVQLVKQ